MTLTSEIAASVRATIRYAVPGETAKFYPTNRSRSYWPAEEHTVEIRNARPNAAQLSLEQQGFVLLREPTAVRSEERRVGKECRSRGGGWDENNKSQ